MTSRTKMGDIRFLTMLRIVMERTEDEELSKLLEEYLKNNEELWSDAHAHDFYTFGTTLAKEWIANHKSQQV